MKNSAYDWAEKLMAGNKMIDPAAVSDSAIRIGSVAMETQAQLMKHHMAVMEKWADYGKKQMSLMQDVKSPMDFVSEANKIATGFGEEMASTIRETVELHVEAGSALSAAVQAEMANGLKAGEALKSTEA